MRKGWEVKNIGDVCKVIAGQSPEGKFYNNNGNGLPFYQGKKDYGEKYIGEPRIWTTKITKEVESNDILMSVRAPVGPINLATQKICIGRGLAAIRATKFIEREFLFYFLLKHENEIVGNVGAVFNSINKAQIEAIEIPLPPLPEQQRIVAILDEAFAAIAKAKFNAEQNIKNAKALFESYLQSVLENGNWKTKILTDVSAVFEDGDWIESKDQAANGVRLIQTGNIGIGIFKDRGEKARYISEATFKTLRCTEVVKGDCLISRLPNPVGRACIVPDMGEKMITAVDCTIVRFQLKEIIPTWFLFYSLSDEYQKQIIKQVNGATRQRISRKNLGLIKIPLPSLDVQSRIIQKLNFLSAKTKKLETIYQAKINHLAELKKSILQKAFSGELTKIQHCEVAL